MKKSNKLYIVFIIVLLIALAIITLLYFNMRNTAKENLNQMLKTAEENSRLNQKISELEKRDNISVTTNTTNTTSMTMPNSNVVPIENSISQNENSEEKDYSVDINKITLEVDNSTITSTNISIIITNNNANDINYDEEYKIQKNVNGVWQDLKYMPNTTWNAMAYITKGHSETTKKLNLENVYGELNKGIYRVSKSIFNGNGGTVNIYSNEFEIK